MYVHTLYIHCMSAPDKHNLILYISSSHTYTKFSDKHVFPRGDSHVEFSILIKGIMDCSVCKLRVVKGCKLN